ncbi:hypothetical protein PSPO01_07506 [Paraphaeosphaeria sporulosa]
MRSSAEYRSRGSTGWLLGPIISSVVPLDDIETLLSIDVAKPPLQRPPAVYVAEQMHASPTPTRPAAHPTLPTASSYAYPTFPSYWEGATRGRQHPVCTSTVSGGVNTAMSRESGAGAWDGRTGVGIAYTGRCGDGEEAPMLKAVIYERVASPEMQGGVRFHAAKWVWYRTSEQDIASTVDRLHGRTCNPSTWHPALNTRPCPMPYEGDAAEQRSYTTARTFPTSQPHMPPSSKYPGQASQTASKLLAKHSGSVTLPAHERLYYVRNCANTDGTTVLGEVKG